MTQYDYIVIGSSFLGVAIVAVVIRVSSLFPD